MCPQAKESPRKFPAGIRVLVVDDDETCLLWVENLLLTCNFKGLKFRLKVDLHGVLTIAVFI